MPWGDASIIYDRSLSIFQQASYPTDTIFPYPPSAVIVFHAFALGGPAAFMGAWYALMVLGLLVSANASLARESRDVRAAWLVIGLIAMLLADSPISWDLRNANSNLIYLGIVMAGYGLLARRPSLAGALIGLSMAFKLYSGLLLIWLLVNGPRRALHTAGLTIIVLWLILPVALFGADGTHSLYETWIGQLRIISDPLLHARLAAAAGGPPLVTLERAVVALTGGDFGSTKTLMWLWTLWSLWLGVLALYAWRWQGSAPTSAPSRSALADWTVLLLAPLPFSPWLEPYHAAPLFLGALLCIVIANDKDALRKDRLAALFALATLFLFIVIRVPFAVRGLGMTTQFVVMVLVLAFIRPRLDRPQAAGLDQQQRRQRSAPGALNTRYGPPHELQTRSTGATLSL
ncbi:MAG: glycosyltransferase family 87 protein [Xanthobacteraceae bacterium]